MTHTRRGMTLMELVIALGITGLMAMAGASTFSSIIDHQRDIVRATAGTERAAALRETIHSWLVSGNVSITSGGLPQMGSRTAGGAAGAGGRGSSGASGLSSLQTVTPGGGPTTTTPTITAAAAAGDELDFTTTAPNPANAPQARMRLFIDGDASTAETGLTLEFQASTQTPLQRIEIEPSIDSMVVDYLDTRTNMWYPASEASTIQPRALRLTLLSTTTVLPGILTLPMIIPMGAQPAGLGR
ncbi:MAG TPA: prepilin-type N-terminal cleavage/methylation domain-containing protein [Gemmatimonadaceae bacterium]